MVVAGVSEWMAKIDVQSMMVVIWCELGGAAPAVFGLDAKGLFEYNNGEDWTMLWLQKKSAIFRFGLRFVIANQFS